jgi:hypothetical protein
MVATLSRAAAIASGSTYGCREDRDEFLRFLKQRLEISGVDHPR